MLGKFSSLSFVLGISNSISCIFSQRLEKYFRNKFHFLLLSSLVVIVGSLINFGEILFFFLVSSF